MRTAPFLPSTHYHTAVIHHTHNHTPYSSSLTRKTRLASRRRPTSDATAVLYGRYRNRHTSTGTSLERRLKQRLYMYGVHLHTRLLCVRRVSQLTAVLPSTCVASSLSIHARALASAFTYGAGHMTAGARARIVTASIAMLMGIRSDWHCLRL